MSRPARILSQSGLYHILFRGINRQNLFEEEKDYEKMLEIIKEVKEEKGFRIHGYCLMTNHVHLFICEKETGDIKKIMHKILTKYVGWYNYKYSRSGTLIGNRYKSEPIEDESYYLNLLRYIHQNPIKSGISQNMEDYKWSSYSEYIKKSAKEIVDTEVFLLMFSEEEKRAIELFKEFHEENETLDFYISETKKLTDEQLKRKIKKFLGDIEIKEIGNMSRNDRNMILMKLRENGFTIGQLERITGISRGIISRAKENVQRRPQ